MFFVNARKGRNGVLLFFLTLLLVFIGFVLGQIPLTVVLTKASGSIYQKTNLDFESLGIDPNWGLFLMLLSFAGGMLALLLAMEKLHLRSWISLISPKNSIDWSRIGISFGLWFGLTLLAEIGMYLLKPEAYVLHFNWRSFLPLVLISLTFIPIQTSFEELFVRGYLLQQLGMAFNSRWISVLLTSLIFGLMHGLNPEVEKFGFLTMMIFYVSFGLLLGICTVLDDRLELAIGMHAANNIYGATIVSFSGSALQTPAIFYLESLDLTHMFIFYFIFAGCFFYFFARKYSWFRQPEIHNKIFSQNEL